MRDNYTENQHFLILQASANLCKSNKPLFGHLDARQHEAWRQCPEHPELTICCQDAKSLLSAILSNFPWHAHLLSTPPACMTHWTHSPENNHLYDHQSLQRFTFLSEKVKWFSLLTSETELSVRIGEIQTRNKDKSRTSWMDSQRYSWNHWENRERPRHSLVTGKGSEITNNEYCSTCSFQFCQYCEVKVLLIPVSRFVPCRSKDASGFRQPPQNIDSQLCVIVFSLTSMNWSGTELISHSLISAKKRDMDSRFMRIHCWPILLWMAFCSSHRKRKLGVFVMNTAVPSTVWCENQENWKGKIHKTPFSNFLRRRSRSACAANWLLWSTCTSRETPLLQNRPDVFEC